MIKVIKGRYKNLSMRVTDNGDLLIKAPRHLSDTKIQEFITSKQSWINKQKQKIETIQNLNSFYLPNIYASYPPFILITL